MCQHMYGYQESFYSQLLNSGDGLNLLYLTKMKTVMNEPTKLNREIPKAVQHLYS